MSDCDRPPAGWSCSRGKGHAGPCSASPTSADSRPPVAVQRAIMTSLLAAGVFKSLLFVAFVVGLVVVLGGSIALGVTVGCGLSFLAAISSNAN